MQYWFVAVNCVWLFVMYVLCVFLGTHEHIVYMSTHSTHLYTSELYVLYLQQSAILKCVFCLLTTCTDFTHVHMIGLSYVPLNTLYKEDSVHQCQPSTHTVCTVRMYCEHVCSSSSV